MFTLIFWCDALDVPPFPSISGVKLCIEYVHAFECNLFLLFSIAFHHLWDTYWKFSYKYKCNIFRVLSAVRWCVTLESVQKTSPDGNGVQFVHSTRETCFTREFWQPDIHTTQLMAAVRSNNLCTNENRVLLCGAVNKRNFIFINYVFQSCGIVVCIAIGIEWCSTNWLSIVCESESLFFIICGNWERNGNEKHVSIEKIMQESCVQLA